MNALAEFIVRGRWQAVLIVAACGAMTIMLPPFGPMLNYLAAAAVALVTLHVGITQGLQVLLIGAVLAGLAYQLLGVQAAVVAVMVTMLWLPCWLLAVQLRLTRQLDYVLRAGVLFGVVLLIAVYIFFGDPTPWWVERLQSLKVMLENAGLPVTNMSDEQLMRQLAGLLSGLIIASLLAGIFGSLLLARWWQSRLVHPGGFREEFCSLRPGFAAGLLTLAVMLASRLVSGTTGDLLAQLVMIMLVAYLLVGLAVTHSLVSDTGRGKVWLVAVYVLLALLPQAMLLLAGLGLLDTWVDFRRRVRGSGDRPGN